jgi:hypothetical protein
MTYSHPAVRLSPLARASSRFDLSARPLAAALLVGGLMSVLLGASGCVRVAPYERETLARRDMELGASGALAAGEEHATAYREGSSGGGDAKGGGCGCN